MKATVIKINGRYEITGLNPTATAGVYEMQYLYSFGGKSYKTFENALKAIARKGFEYVAVNANNLVCAYD